MGDDHYQINADDVSHAGLALVYVLLEHRKKLNHHKKKRTKLPLSGQLSFCTYSKPLPITPSNQPFSRGCKSTMPHVCLQVVSLFP